MLRSARLHEGQTTPSVEERELPRLGRHDVLVRIEATMMTSYLASLIDGSGGFETPPRPFTPGSEATGTVEAVGDGVCNVAPGTRVYCDPFVTTTIDGTRFDSAFVGCFPVSGDGQRVFEDYADGTLATHVRLPSECVTSVEPALERASMDTLCRLGWFGTAHSAFTKSSFPVGGSVAVTGANGLLGSSAVALALAMGASTVHALGRNLDKLNPLPELDPRVVVSTSAPPPASVDLVISCASGGGSDLVQASISSLRPDGAVVILASLDPPPVASGLVTNNLAIHGSFWFPRKTPSLLIQMIASGQLNLDWIENLHFSLEDVGLAMDAARNGVPTTQQVVVRP